MARGECSSQADTTGKPRSRQRTYKPAPVLEVPDIEENASERKRVLNVLAQRRYSQCSLIQYDASDNAPSFNCLPVSVGEKKRLRRQKERNKEKGQEIKENSDITGESQSNDDEEINTEIISTSNQSTCNTGGLDEIDFSLAGWATTMFNNISSNASMPLLLPDTANISDFSSTSITDEGSGEEGFIFSNSERLEGNLSDMLPPTWDSTSPSSSSDGSFADSYLLPVHELTLLRAVMRIAERIGCHQQMWNLEAVSPFAQGIATPSEQLPVAWKPTASQLLVPHHPLLDFLPWPGVRDRVINIFSMPDEMRPPNATGPLALVNFAYDFEDNSEGVRIYGGDPYDPNSWEVGQVLFERWWFIFDRDVIENSNRWRRLRGAPPLALKGTPC